MDAQQFRSLLEYIDIRIDLGERAKILRSAEVRQELIDETVAHAFPPLTTITIDGNLHTFDKNELLEDVLTKIKESGL